MYLLSHIARQNAIVVEVEYRLVCSGCLMPANVIGDPLRSDGATILLTEPFTLLVASRPYDRYPQELALRFSAERVTESDGQHSHSFFPDAEIARDFAAVLTLFCRRLITVFAKVHERYSDPHMPQPLRDWPTEIASAPRAVSWALRPASVVYGIHGDQVTEHQPPPVEFNAATFSRFVVFLPDWKLAAHFIRAARLYALALELIESRFSIAYLLLVSAAETMAGAALNGMAPAEAEKVKRYETLRNAAIRAGCAESAANDLALVAAQENPWSRWKFVKFLIDNVEQGELATRDDVMLTPPELCPAGEAIKAALNRVYGARSGASHAGQEWPISAQVGPSLNVPLGAYADVLNEKVAFPPIGWFERVVQSALMRFAAQSIHCQTTDRAP